MPHSRKYKNVLTTQSHLLTIAMGLTAFSLFPLHSLADENTAAESEKALEKFVVVGKESEIQQLEQSANAVDVIDLQNEQTLTADLSEVLAREPGISIRRMGGLGSREEFSLNGLSGEQIRFYVDGIPMEMSGNAFGLSTIHVNLVKHAEIYHGVVPIKFGSDALGGIVNFVTEQGKEESGGSFSHLIGDFNTRRTSLVLNHTDQKTGFFAQLNAFSDYSDNNYEVDVTIPNELGQQQPATVERFHDAYEGNGATLEMGYRDQSWADLFQLSLYSNEYYKEIQHNITMSKVYGEPTVDRKTYGANLRYRYQLNETVYIEAAGGASEIKTDFQDTADYSTNWSGNLVVTPAPHPGEIGDPCECIYWTNNEFSIVYLGWQLAPGHALNFSAAPTWSRQVSQNHYIQNTSADTTNLKRDMFSLVTAADYTFDFYDDRLQNVFFVKRYNQDRSADQLDIISKEKERFEVSVEQAGWGNSIRYKLNDWALAKVSYEQATRLPSFLEVFGDSVSILPNAELIEETSNNYNLSIAVDSLVTEYGTWRGEGNLFLRDISDYIVLTTFNDYSQFQNAAAVESKGFFVSGSWTSPEDFIDLSANYTNFDLINTSTDGLYGQYKGETVPNVPTTFFNSKLSLKWLGVISSFDELKLNWNYRFVERYELIWGDDGLSQFNPYVKAQESHALATTYTRDIFPYTFSVTAEVQNLTDEKLYDHYGVQRSGRAYYLKTVIEF